MKLKDYNKKLYPYKIRLMIYKILKHRTQKFKINNNKKLKIKNKLFMIIKIKLIKSNIKLQKIKMNLTIY